MAMQERPFAESSHKLNLEYFWNRTVYSNSDHLQGRNLDVQALARCSCLETKLYIGWWTSMAARSSNVSQFVVNTSVQGSSKRVLSILWDNRLPTIIAKPESSIAKYLWDLYQCLLKRPIEPLSFSSSFVTIIPPPQIPPTPPFPSRLAPVYPNHDNSALLFPLPDEKIRLALLYFIKIENVY